MSRLTLPPPPIHGKVPTAAWFDTLFTAFETALNGAVDRWNFRPTTGIRNRHKVYSHAWLPLVWSVPTFNVEASTTLTMKGLLSYPAYWQTTEGDEDALISESNSADKPFYLMKVEAGHTGLANWVAETDTIEAQVTYRMNLKSISALYSLAFATPHVQTVYDFGGLLCDHLSLDLKVVTGAGSTRVVKNPRVIVWTKVPHVL